MSRHKAIRNLTADDYEDYYEDDDGYGDDYGHSPSNVAANITTKTTTKTPAKTTTTTNAAKPGTTSKTTPATTTSKPATTNVTKPTTTSTSKPTSTSTLKPTSTSTSTSTSKPTSTSTSTSTKKQALTQDDTYDHDYLDGGGGEYYDDYGYDDEEYWEQEPEYDDYDASAKPKSSTSTKTTPAKTTTSKPTTTPTTKKTVTSTTTTTSTSASKNATTVTSTSTSTSTKVTITSAETTPSKPLRTAEEMAETQAAIDAIRMAKMAVTDTSTTTSTSTSTPHKYSAAADIFDTPIPSTSTSTTSSAVQTPRGLPHSSTTAELSSHLPLGPVISRSASAALGPKEVYSAATSARLAREKESLLESESTRDMKPLLNMVVIGHVDAGKSTLMGHLLYLQGRVSSKLMHKFEKESKEMGKASFVYAWVLDEQEDERARGVTVDVAVNYFETPTKRITLLDAPGHKDFIPNMISGAAQADAAVLVIPAVRGEFESGFMDDGQTKEHAILARSLGVSQLIVAINKLDTMDWSQQRYQEIQLVLLPFLKSAGFKEKDVTFVPVSGLTGVNILTNNEPALRAWYTGPTLLDLIDAFQLPTRHVDKPFRMCIVDVFKSQSLGTTVCGKIESGAIIPRDRVLIQPLNEIATIKALESRGEPLNIAKAGDNVEIGLKDITDATALLPGQFLSDPTHPIPIVHRFRGQIITMAYKVPLLEGTQVILFTQSTSEPATITRLNALLDKTKGDITKKNPRAIPRSSSAIIEITVKRPICVELFRSYRELGRFTLRRQGDTVGVGIITKLFRELS